MKNHTSQGLRITLLVYSISSLLSGLFHMFSQQTVVAQDQAIERILGGAMLAFALGAGLVYRERIWEKVKIVILMLIAWMILYTITLTWGILTGGMHKEAWVSTFIGAILSILLTFLYIREKKLRRN
ncbi:hypothetical protein ACFLYK_02675 [Candidatus Cloacimonadota bacterium]